MEMFKNKKEQTKHWMDYAEKHLVGKTVKAVSWMTEKEAKPMDWYSRPLIIEFTDGSVIYPSADDEGNNGGALFGFSSADHKELTFPVNGA